MPKCLLASNTRKPTNWQGTLRNEPAKRSPKRSSPHCASELAREQRKDEGIEDLVEEIMAIGKHCAALPLLDARSADQIIGYGERGLSPSR